MMRSATIRRPSSNFEVYAWMFMRISGLLLLFLTLYHFYYMHFVIGVDHIDFKAIVGRWTGPEGLFWRVYDLFLLIFAFTHGVNGARAVASDYISSRAGLAAVKMFLLFLWVALTFIGTWIIFTFHPGMTTPFGR